MDCFRPITGPLMCQCLLVIAKIPSLSASECSDWSRHGHMISLVYCPRFRLRDLGDLIKKQHRCIGQLKRTLKPTTNISANLHIFCYLAMCACPKVVDPPIRVRLTYSLGFYLRHVGMGNHIIFNWVTDSKFQRRFSGNPAAV